MLSLCTMVAAGAPGGIKHWADSHYFAVPARILDISTSFAFIFPFQHFHRGKGPDNPRGNLG